MAFCLPGHTSAMYITLYDVMELFRFEIVSAFLITLLLPFDKVGDMSEKYYLTN